jgi:hypothetical protein
MSVVWTNVALATPPCADALAAPMSVQRDLVRAESAWGVCPVCVGLVGRNDREALGGSAEAGA